MRSAGQFGVLLKRMSISSISLPAFAKVNLTLDVLSKRPDGYHSLVTVFQAISLADQLVLSMNEEPGIKLVVHGDSAPADETNLAYRAAAAAIHAVNRETSGLRIDLTKNVPSQAGLGGGSSDAATALAGTNELLKLGLSDGQLMEIAAELGSDVAFFLSGGTASARGRGEALSPLPDCPPIWLVVVKPDVSVSTAWAYGQLAAIPNRVSARGTKRMEEAVQAGEMEHVIARMTNDFEAALLEQISELAALHDDLRMARARNARLCGSGSAMFGACYTEAEANETARLLRTKYANVWICRTLGRNESSAIELAQKAMVA
jgi:4-diphosphocytidyl-2-C-methyl-D-erythritol kinase